MNSKKYNISGILTVVLIIMMLILASICAVVILTGDRQAPTIMIDEEYLEKCNLNDESDILKAVSAVDDKTEKVEVFVLNIIDYEDGTYKINFSARDDSGNTASKSIVVENANGLEDVIKDAQIDLEEVAETSDSAEEDESLPPECPRITLVTEKIEIEDRSDFRYLSYIESIKDDKDSQDDLFQRINVVVDSDPDEAGRYIVRYSVKDTDGNKSNIAKLIVMTSN